MAHDYIDDKVIIVMTSEIGNKVIIVSGTKDTSIGVRVDDELLAILKRLAETDERPIGAMARKLILEALRSRGEIK